MSRFDTTPYIIVHYRTVSLRIFLFGRAIACPSLFSFFTAFGWTNVSFGTFLECIDSNLASLNNLMEQKCAGEMSCNLAIMGKTFL